MKLDKRGDWVTLMRKVGGKPKERKALGKGQARTGGNQEG